MVPITALYAALLALLFLVLSLRVVVLRKTLGQSLSDGGDTALRRRIRAHGNCAEYAPFGVLLLLLAELQGAPALALHSLGLMLLAGRIAHAAALSRSRPWPAMRISGMLATFAMLALAALGLALHSLL